MHPVAFVISQNRQCSLFAVSRASAWTPNVQNLCALQLVCFFFFLKTSPLTDVKGLFWPWPFIIIVKSQVYSDPIFFSYVYFLQIFLISRIQNVLHLTSGQ